MPQDSGLYHFRLTDENRDMLVSVVTWLRSQTVVHLAVHEISKQGKAHIHVIFDTKCKSTLIQNFHKEFKKRWCGNKSFSCETLKKELENNYIYLCKGTRDTQPDVLYKLIDIDVTKYHNKYWEDKPKEQDYKLNPKLLVKAKSKTWSELLTEELIEKYPKRKWEYCAADIDDLWSIVLKNLGKNSKKLNGHIVRDLVLGQLNALNPDCYGLHKSLKHSVFSDLFGEL